MQLRHRAIAAAVTGALLVAACGGGATQAPGEPTKAPEPTQGAATQAPGGEKVTLTMQTWRVEDGPLWEPIFAEFQKTHPDISFTYDPSPTTEYDAAVDSRVQGGTAGDLIMCRPYDVTRNNIKKGYFEQIDGQVQLDIFEQWVLDAWSNKVGENYCVPMAAVMAAMMYNKTIFNEIGITAPTVPTHAEFLALLQKVKEHGKYEPLAMGTGEPWVLRGQVYESIGPNYWKGEEGRQGLLNKTMTFNDPQFVAPLTDMSEWTPYLPEGYAAINYVDAQQMFALGKGAVYPAGSWDITAVTAQGADVGVFAPPLPKAGDDLYVQYHPDIAIGVNAQSKHKAEAIEFLKFVATSEFQKLYANSLPGFFPLAKDSPSVDHPLANAWLDIAKSAKGLTPRLSTDRTGVSGLMEQILPSVFDGSKTPAEVAAELQQGLETYYYPTLEQ